MLERSPIFSAAQNNQRIGYIEGDAAFDLLGRRRANYSAKSGNLRALDSGNCSFGKTKPSNLWH